MDYEAYYYVKFQRYPKITKKLPQGGQGYDTFDYCFMYNLIKVNKVFD